MRLLIAVSVLATLAGAAMAGPRTIPWLSQTVRPATAAPAPSANDVAPPPAADDGFEITLLAPAPLDGIGTLRGAFTGFPRDIWGGTDARTATALVRDLRDGGVAATRSLFERFLLAETLPPRNAGRELLLTRVDRLIGLGSVHAAARLVDAAGTDTPELFRRGFDLALLRDDTDPLCDGLTASPRLTPTFPVRVFCLARAGDWNAAALTLALGHDLGAIEPEMEETLARFLDPGAFDEDTAPPPPVPYTPLHFVLRDAVALPRPPGPLPLAFVHHDLFGHAPLRSRIEAAERLARVGTLSPGIVLRTYRSGKASASGNPWDRAIALARLDQAVEDGDPDRIARALLDADDRFLTVGLRHVLAADISYRAAVMDVAAADPRARAQLAELFLLAGLPDRALDLMPARPSARDALHLGLVSPSEPLPEAALLQPLEEAVLAGLTRSQPPGDDSALISRRIDAGLWGEAFLATLALLSPGTEIDPGDLEAALFLLRRLGLEDDARRIALETLLLRPFG